MDARAASIEAGRNLARTYAERGKLFRKIDNFQRQLRAHGLSGRYCLLYQKTPDSAHNLDALRCIGISKRELLDRLAGPNALLNLSYLIHPPLLLKFERRIFCDLDPSEIIYWMTQMEIFVISGAPYARGG